MEKQLKGHIINNQYKIIKNIGQGSFGLVFKVQNIKTNELFALKIEIVKGSKYATLEKEEKFYQILKGIEGISKIYWSGKIEGYNAFIMDLLGRELSSLFTQYRTFSEITVSLIAIKVLTIIEEIHNHGSLFNFIFF